MHEFPKYLQEMMCLVNQVSNKVTQFPCSINTGIRLLVEQNYLDITKLDLTCLVNLPPPYKQHYL